MSELHDALTWLSPIEWSDVPTDDLAAFVSEANEAGELICNSVPPPADGTPFHSSTPSQTEPNTAKSAGDVSSSEARPFPPHDDHEQLQKAWGKPVKINAKDNPLGAVIYKMAGKDRHGAWFARSSVHEGIGFDKFKRALQREFAQSLSVSGGPGAGAVRGIAADRRIHRTKLDDGRQVEVLQLSAQFPGPTTAREFTALVISSEGALSDKSAAESDGQKHVPRHFMLMSKPVKHPDAPDRPGHVRGQYESVEMIREIPLHKIKSSSQSASEEREGGSEARESKKSDSSSKSKKDDKDDKDSGSHDPELNPVEWVMVTRSDPGGGIPRFLVDRGTPEAMLGDLKKFLDWACGMDEIPDPDDDLEKQEQASKQAESGAAQSESADAREAGSSGDSAPAGSNENAETGPQAGQTGILSTLGAAIQNGIDAYAPAVVSRNIHHYVHFENQNDDTSDSSDTSSVVSFLSATEGRDAGHVGGGPHASSKSLPNDLLRTTTTQTSREEVAPQDENSHDREARKVVKERHKLDQKLVKKREEEEERYQKATSKDDADHEKAKERRDKEIAKLEDRHRRAVEKSLRKEEKERRKADEKRRKKDDGNKLSLVVRERDDFRTQADLSRRENALLLRQIDTLKRENALLTQELNKLGGEDALRRVREQLLQQQSRPVSVQSGSSEAGRVQLTTSESVPAMTATTS